MVKTLLTFEKLSLISANDAYKNSSGLQSIHFQFKIKLKRATILEFTVVSAIIFKNVYYQKYVQLVSKLCELNLLFLLKINRS